MKEMNGSSELANREELKCRLDCSVSIIMGVYNCEDTIKEAIQAIRNQTFKNWELIICDDGSADQTFSIVKEYTDKDDRIILLHNETNLGLNKTLNRCLDLAAGQYIARMDGDDICSHDRLIKQLSFLESNNEYSICGTWMKLFDKNGIWGETHVPEYPTPEQVVSGSPICHATTMIRRDALESVGGYSEDPRTLRVEDVDLWIKLYEKGYKAYNLQEPLYAMRNDQNALNRRKYKYRINSTYVRLKGCRKLGLKPIMYIKAFKPMIYGLVPGKIRQLIKKKTSHKSEEKENS